MKRLSLIVFIFLVCLMTSTAKAAPERRFGNPPTAVIANWDDDDGVSDWIDELKAPAAEPTGAEEIKIQASGTICTLDSVETLVLTPDSPSGRMRVYAGAELDIVPGSILDGPSWFRSGVGGTGGGQGWVNQTGGLLKIRAGREAGRLVIGDQLLAGTDCTGHYLISGGTITYAPDDIYTYVTPNVPIWGHLCIGSRADPGIFTVQGSSPVIDMKKLLIGGDDVGRGATGTLEFQLTGSSPGSVSPIQVQNTVLNADGDASIANLVVSLISGTAPESPIVLVKNSSSTAVAGIFDSVSGDTTPWDPANEGDQVVLFSRTYTLTYLYNADAGAIGNDIALVPEPATIALLGLGSLIAIRRNRK